MTVTKSMTRYKSKYKSMTMTRYKFKSISETAPQMTMAMTKEKFFLYKNGRI